MGNLRDLHISEERRLYKRLEDPIPGPETIGPSLDGPDHGIYQPLPSLNISNLNPKLDGRSDGR
jgi:hypothetical protein